MFKKKKNKKVYSVIDKARHPAENTVSIIAAVITVAIYVGITYLLIFGANDGSKIDVLLNLFGVKARGIKIINNIGGPAIFGILLFLLLKLCMASADYVGKASINNIRLQDSTYDKIKEIYNDFCEFLQLEKPPIVYITKIDKNSKEKNEEENKPSYLGVTVCSDKAICLSGKTVKEAIDSDDYSKVRYELANSLGDIYLGHYDIPIVMLTFVARLIPYFHEFCERILCYSTDKFTQELIGKEETLTYIYKESYDDDFFANIDQTKAISTLLQSLNEFEKEGRAYENFLSEKPITVYRLEAIFYDKPGKLL